MAPITIYGLKRSPFCRNVFLTCDLLGVEYEIKEVDPIKGESKTPDFLAINPQHKVPVYKEGDFILTESYAIGMYLLEKYADKAAAKKLYPADVQTRAKIHMIICFDMGTFIGRQGPVIYPVLHHGTKPPEMRMQMMKEALKFLDDYIKPTGWVAGTDHATIADIYISTSYSFIKSTGLFDMKQFPNLDPWLSRVRGMFSDYDGIAGIGDKQFSAFFSQMLAKAK